jgi:hypothetical protein
MNPRWKVVEDRSTALRRFMLENATGGLLHNRKGRGSGVSRPRRWATKEAAQQVADDLNERAEMEYFADMADAHSY